MNSTNIQFLLTHCSRRLCRGALSVRSVHHQPNGHLHSHSPPSVRAAIRGDAASVRPQPPAAYGARDHDDEFDCQATGQHRQSIGAEARQQTLRHGEHDQGHYSGERCEGMVQVPRCWQLRCPGAKRGVASAVGMG